MHLRTCTVHIQHQLMSRARFTREGARPALFQDNVATLARSLSPSTGVVAVWCSGLANAGMLRRSFHQGDAMNYGAAHCGCNIMTPSRNNVRVRLRVCWIRMRQSSCPRWYEANGLLLWYLRSVWRWVWNVMSINVADELSLEFVESPLHIFISYETIYVLKHLRLWGRFVLLVLQKYREWFIKHLTE